MVLPDDAQVRPAGIAAVATRIHRWTAGAFRIRAATPGVRTKDNVWCSWRRDDKGHSLVGVAKRDCGRDYAFSDGPVPCRTSDCLVAISGRLETFDLSLRNPILRYQTTFSTVGITGSFQ